MSILQAEAKQYTFSPDQIRKLIAADMGKKEDEIQVKFVVQDTAHERSGSPSYEVTKIEVTIGKESTRFMI